jgi:hypothetical protein
LADIFLSYSREDQTTARRFAAGFERAGFSVWWDQTLNAGEAYDEVTEKALEEARAVVVLWSRNSVASRWVRAEATQADRSGTLVPAMIEDCKRPIMFELKQTADLSNWSGDPNDKTWLAYVASVRRFVEHGRHAPDPVATGSGPLAVDKPCCGRDWCHRPAVRRRCVVGNESLVQRHNFPASHSSCERTGRSCHGCLPGGSAFLEHVFGSGAGALL